MLTNDSKHSVWHRCLEPMKKMIRGDDYTPYHTIIIEGFHYFLTIVNDCTRFTWVYLLCAKSDVGVFLPDFFLFSINSIWSPKQIYSLWQCTWISSFWILSYTWSCVFLFMCWNTTTKLCSGTKTLTHYQCCSCLIFSIQITFGLLDWLHYHCCIPHKSNSISSSFK